MPYEVSLLIPARNAEHTLKRTVESALQTSGGSERVRNILGLLESLDMLKINVYIGAEYNCEDLERLVGDLRTRKDNPLVIKSNKRRKYAYVLTALGLAAYALL